MNVKILISIAGSVMASILSLVDGMERHWKYKITFDLSIQNTFKA